ncbi:uncharacterized protein LOC135336731 isoform X2 [Halichondria panicea]|uniref:uncharacterized protein LOC135336731 isoform X2 n=1 Tax=Halichondria panicea TaxID=6063 RepID=UPI00312B83BB
MQFRCEAPVIVNCESEVPGLSGIFLYPGENITVTCNRGFYLKNGLSITHCQTNGSWSMLPVCKRCQGIKNCRSTMCTKRANTVCLECLGSYTNQVPQGRNVTSHTLLVRMDWEQSHNLMRSIGKSAIPVLRFFLNLTEELNSISTMIDETTRTLNLTTEVTGEYRCVASNVVGNTTWLVIVGMNSILVYVSHEVFQDYFPFSWPHQTDTHLIFLSANLVGTGLWMLIVYYCYYIEFFVKI